METGKEMIPIDLHLKNFKMYLDANSRCILSAKFGNGKSYFISKFMDEYSDEYLFIPIYPVNYQVMDNKDIFELIKRDIVIRLLSNNLIEIESFDFNAPFLCSFYFANNTTDVFKDILDLIPSINLYGFDINIGNVIRNIDRIKKKYRNWREETIKTKQQLVDNYINQFTKKEGSIYEFDAISQLICDIIKEYKHNNPSKKVVLIIEDLDRIDPAHIFRILNVFSAHFDKYDTGLDDNKFCLDKILSVCDISNIRNIYSHIYGEKTDFDGYISKFSNCKAFKYSLQDNLKDYIINTLLDKELVEYKVICKHLVTQIIGSMDRVNTPGINLRIVNERISKAKSLIKTQKISLEIPLNEFYVTTESVFVYFLALLKSFDINFKSIIDEPDVKREMMLMVGKYWPLIKRYSTNILFFNLNQDTISVSYLIPQHGTTINWGNEQSFHIKLNGNELIDLDMKYLDVEHNPLAPRLYSGINHIAKLFYTEAIV